MLNCEQLDPFWCQVWWKSVQWFQSYSAFSKFKMAVAAILDSIQPEIWLIRRVERYRTYLAFKFGKNQSNSSKVTALCIISRWRRPPSWILEQKQIRSSRRAVRQRTYLAFQLGENRSNGSTVIAFYLNSRWQPPLSWILSQSLI